MRGGSLTRDNPSLRSSPEGVVESTSEKGGIGGGGGGLGGDPILLYRGGDGGGLGQNGGYY